jgi:hypothetical protein
MNCVVRNSVVSVGGDGVVFEPPLSLRCCAQFTAHSTTVMKCAAFPNSF